MENKYTKIAIIGMGHLGQALKRGLENTRNGAILSIQTSNYSKDNTLVVSEARIVFVCVRKTILAEVLLGIRDFLQKDTIIVSVVAGASIKSIREILSENKIVRIMPNIAISINQGIIGTYNSTLDLDRFLSRLGTVFKIKNESMLDVFTLAGGCGPGIVAYLMQSLTSSFIEIGIEKKIASGMVIKTLQGTLNILVESKISSEQLLSQVATKGGITESVVKYFDEKKLKIIIANGLQKGMQKLLKK